MSTLLKHEWLRTRGMLGMILGLAALLVALGSLLTVTRWPLLDSLGTGLALVAALALVPVVQFALAIDYWRSSYGRTGYFTQSLPIRGSRIFTAKLLYALGISLLGIVSTLLLGGILWSAVASRLDVSGNPLAALADLWEWLTGMAPVWVVVAGTVGTLALFLSYPAYYYFAASVGSEQRWNRLGAAGPVVVFVLTYLATQLLTLVGMLILPYGIGATDGELGLVSFSLITEMQQANPTNDVMPIGFIPVLLLMALALIARTAYSWNRKVALV